jgi:hypothetical protein
MICPHCGGPLTKRDDLCPDLSLCLDCEWVWRNGYQGAPFHWPYGDEERVYFYVKVHQPLCCSLDVHSSERG